MTERRRPGDGDRRTGTSWAPWSRCRDCPGCWRARRRGAPRSAVVFSGQPDQDDRPEGRRVQYDRAAVAGRCTIAATPVEGRDRSPSASWGWPEEVYEALSGLVFGEKGK